MLWGFKPSVTLRISSIASHQASAHLLPGWGCEELPCAPASMPSHHDGLCALRLSHCSPSFLPLLFVKDFVIVVRKVANTATNRGMRIKNMHMYSPPLGSSWAVVLPACVNPGWSRGQETAIGGERRRTLVRLSIKALRRSSPQKATKQDPVLRQTGNFLFLWMCACVLVEARSWESFSIFSAYFLRQCLSLAWSLRIQ